MFIYFWERERERERENKWERSREREGDTESKAGSRLWAVSTKPDMGLEPTNCEPTNLRTWARVRCLNDWATQVPHQWPSFIGTPLAGFNGLFNSTEFYTKEISLKETIIITYPCRTCAQFSRHFTFMNDKITLYAISLKIKCQMLNTDRLYM